MTTINLTADTFQDTVTGDGITLVDWWAGWCGPCMQFAPVYEAASERHPDITFAKIDTEAEQELSAAVQITSIPTLMAFRDGVLLYAQPGALPAQALDEIIDQVRKLDMDQIRREIAEQEAQSAAGAPDVPEASQN
ncbi:thioredoxin family protein [Aeromicrobium duanguangcaii]|uniref:Thioredoxin family protein n=1 Tax=Aeromicrobium duanguangcaii TaxID=2968086 RepID=A0ABY5KIA7_9ACTN|nr:thioredoxin family protein [Aeromicrobium duanguangcaii]MCD9153181.1 thioredoxin family protein [Aeromicrobium duanguangcaii]MCL3836826.1 thioredoxin family protein [Aeromicrobium duanguangcaii]UUI69718.1 thioredoxin family protein [Aeromicrobium duanguangcaii]